MKLMHEVQTHKQILHGTSNYSDNWDAKIYTSFHVWLILNQYTL